MTTDTEEEATVTVCAVCLCASCWQGIFMCDVAKFADITQRTKSELKELDLEWSGYWDL